MGCDIHMYAERKVRDLKSLTFVDGKMVEKIEPPYWSKIDDVFKSKYFDVSRPIGKYNELTTDEPYEGRNYSLFALLADVRNQFGIKPLSLPKGLPDDVSDEVKKESDDWDGDGHSHSYFTLDELLSVEWDFTIIPQSGLVDPKNYKLFKETGRPYEWCQGTTNTEYRKIKWKISLRENCQEFIDSLYDLKEYGRKNNIETKDIRLVFFFDN